MFVKFVVYHQDDTSGSQQFDSPSAVTNHLRGMNGFTNQWHVAAEFAVNELASVIPPDGVWPDQPPSRTYIYTGEEWLVKRWEWLWENLLSSEEGIAYHTLE